MGKNFSKEEIDRAFVNAFNRGLQPKKRRGLEQGLGAIAGKAPPEVIEYVKRVANGLSESTRPASGVKTRSATPAPGN